MEKGRKERIKEVPDLNEKEYIKERKETGKRNL